MYEEMNICLVNICEYRRNSIVCSVNCSVIINNKNFQKNFTRVKLIFGLGSTHTYTHIPYVRFFFNYGITFDSRPSGFTYSHCVSADGTSV